MKPVFMTYTKNDIINLAILMIVGVVVIPMFVSSGYWYTSILIPWLCLALATIGQQIIMGYTCLLYTSPSPRDKRQSRMPSSA